MSCRGYAGVDRPQAKQGVTVLAATVSRDDFVVWGGGRGLGERGEKAGRLTKGVRVWPSARGSVRSATISVAGPTEPLAAGHTLLLQACTHAHTPGWQAADWSHYSGRLLVTLFRLAAGHTFPAGPGHTIPAGCCSHYSGWLLVTLFRLALATLFRLAAGHTIPAGCWSHYSGRLLVTLRLAAGHTTQFG